MKKNTVLIFSSYLKLWLLGIFLYVAGIGGNLAIAGGQGVLESAALEKDAGVLVLRGWVATEKSSNFAVQARVLLGARQVYLGRLGIGGGLRPDVVAATGREQWLNSGFEIRLRVPDDLKTGSYPVVVRVRTSDGQEIVLDVLDGAKTVHWQAPPQPGSWARLALGLAVLLPLVCWGVSLWVRWPGYIAWAGSARVFAVALLASFTLLVAGGWTGSSLALLVENDTLVQHDAVPWVGEAQPVRADEWLVITAMALGQFNQYRSGDGLPDVSTVLTSAGHNMNVVGMTGVPVANMAALAKPATWGFFFLEMRQALAWYWWLPFFGCFFAVWWALSVVFGLPWRWAAALSGLLSAAPLSVGWSGWPAYVVGFAVLGWGAWLQGWCAKGRWQALSWGALAGWATAGAFLTLYPAWLWVLASLLLPLAGAWLYEQRGRWRKAQGFWATLGLVAVAGFFCAAWWWHAKDAVAAIQGTVYPGSRLETGGYLDAWFMVKGLLAPVLFFHASEAVSPSDGAAFICLFLPLGGWLIWQQCQTRRWDALANVCLLFIVWVLWFSFFGVPDWVARFTLWSMVPVYRVDIGLLLAQTVLWALVLRQVVCVPKGGTGLLHMGWRWKGAMVFLVAMGAVFAMQQLPVSALAWFEPSLLLLALVGYVVLCWWLLSGQHVQGGVLYGVWTLAAGLTFNPLLQAPQQLSVHPVLQQRFSEARLPTTLRVAVVAGAGQALSLGGHRQTLALMAAGVPVATGVLYHPPLDFWYALDPEHKYEAVYNRYQHLLLEHADLPEERAFSLTLPRLDLVLLQINTRRFDFARMGVGLVLVHQNDAEYLRANPRLLELEAVGVWAIFKVL